MACGLATLNFKLFYDQFIGLIFVLLDRKPLLAILMKSLIKITSALSFLVLFSGCSIYQQVSIESNTPQNDRSEFVVENDSVSIIYSFHGQGGFIGIDIFNKLNQPLYVDWRKSALIIEDESFTLWKDEASLNGVSSSVQVMDNEGIVYSQGNIGGSLVKNDNISFIPPHSKIVVNNYNLNSPYFNIPKELGQKITFYTRSGELRRGRKYSFSAEHSPYIFRIFLSMANNDSFRDPIHFDNSFWISEIVTSSADPHEFDVYFGNQFYNEKTSTAAKKLVGGALIGAIVVAAASVKTPPNQ